MNLHIPMRPMAYKRHRTKQGGGVYVPEEYQEWKAVVGLLMTHQMKRGGAAVSHQAIHLEVQLGQEDINIVRTETVARRRGKLRGDLDNYIKAILDAGNGVLYEDDRQVEWINGGFV